MSIVTMVIEVVLAYQLYLEGFSLAAWGWFLLPHALAVPVAILYRDRILDRHRQTLVLMERSLSFAQSGKPTIEIEYDDIAGYWIRDVAAGLTDPNAAADSETYAHQVGKAWLRIEASDGRAIEVYGKQSSSWVAPKDLIVRVLGPRVPLWAIQGRGARPDDVVAGMVWDFYGDPPIVLMEPGKRYRYLNSPEAAVASAFSGAIPFIPVIIMALGMANSVFTLAARIAVLIVGTAVLCLAIAFARIGWNARQAEVDRFEGSPEGLWVNRGDRRWLMTDPRPTHWHPLRRTPHNRPLLRYGRGLRSYLFDPRMIEEDV